MGTTARTRSAEAETQIGSKAKHLINVKRYGVFPFCSLTKYFKADVVRTELSFDTGSMIH